MFIRQSIDFDIVDFGDDDDDGDGDGDEDEEVEAVSSTRPAERSAAYRGEGVAPSRLFGYAPERRYSRESFSKAKNSDGNK